MKVCNEVKLPILTWPDLKPGDVFQFSENSESERTYMRIDGTRYVYLHSGFVYSDYQNDPVVFLPDACVVPEGLD